MPEKSYVTFENHSNSNVTYDVIWDGSRTASLGPGREHSIQTTPGGHTLTWKVSNNGSAACSGATPQLVKGHSYRFWCTY